MKSKKTLSALVGRRVVTLIVPALFALAFHVQAQTSQPSFEAVGTAAQSANDDNKEANTSAAMIEELRLLREVIERLEKRVSELEAEKRPTPPAAVESRTAAPATVAINDAPQVSQSVEDRKALDFLKGTTFNLMLDGYYGYNFNKPVGRINLLRAYDVLSNSFSLNQAALIVEHGPDVQAGRRFGMRLDLQFGQATETLQGNPANELRPQTYRPVFQAFGTYVAPVGNGLSVDFGKWASSLGIESNYSKDQMNYSRSYFFNFLPFYHFGFRARYQVNDKLTVMYHLVNGVQQSEDFNGFKSQHIALIFTPVKKVSWQVNYYEGREGGSVEQVISPGVPTLPTQPGFSTNVIRHAPGGRLHILDTYATWNPTDKLTLAAEGDYVITRASENAPPSRVTGGAAYARYQFSRQIALAGRAEYLSDRGGSFSTLNQALKETTVTADYKVADGFLLRGEWRRDFSNQRFFLTNTQGLLKKDQNTVTLGLIWWVGQKEGAW